MRMIAKSPERQIEIHLVNHTHYLSSDLMRIFKLVVDDYAKNFFDWKHESLIIRCVYRRLRDGFCGGWAYYNNNQITLKLSKDYKPYSSLRTFEQELANTLHHEIGRAHV